MNFTEHHFVLLTCRLLLFIIVVCNAFHLSSLKRTVTLLSFFPTIAAYTLYAGLRWGRGIDYNLYYWLYKDINAGIGREDNEPLFELLIKISGWLGLEWKHFVFFMSFFLIFSGCFFLRNFRKESVLLLPFFVFNLSLAETLMRWYLGFSFILIGLYFLLQNKQRFFWVFSLLGFLVHYGLAIDILGFYLIWIFSRKYVMKPTVALIIYIGIFFLFTPQFMSYFADFIQNVNLGTRFLMYQNNAEAWLVGDANDEVRGQLSMTNLISTIYLICIGYSCYVKNKTPVLACLFSWALIGWIFRPAAVQIEIAMRIHALFLLMGSLYSAYMCYDILLRKRSLYSSTIRFFTVLFVLYNIYSLVMSPVFNVSESETYFIWDAAGRAVLH